MRYIVFGGSGFVGRYTIKALQEAMQNSHIAKGQIICADIQKPQNLAQNVEFHSVDISQDFNFGFKKDDIVIHLAARAYAPKPPLKPFGTHTLKEYFFAVNVDGTKRIVSQMLEFGCKNLIYFSTDMVYGKPQYLPVDTKHHRNPFGYYGLSKKESENFIIAQRKSATGGGGVECHHFSPKNDFRRWEVWNFAQTF